MTSNDARYRFEKLLSQRANNSHPEVIVSCMLEFYQQERVSDCKIEGDGDMLLYQWGAYDWGQGRWFDLNVTRQFTLADDWDDDGIFHLSVSAKFTPNADLDALGSGNCWSGSPSNLSKFSALVMKTDAMQALVGRPCDRLDVEYSQVG
ncbi:MAG: hypothetical protein JNK37_19665 [Verrucomicrobiales bacterium]|nr:hypothetical protein [Verrucomicrobiales bacterium]